MNKTKKGFVHIKEYDLTKMIVDLLDVEIGSNFQLLEMGFRPLQYKDKPLILPEYKSYLSAMNSGVVARPFVNQAHSEFFINMFSHIQDCETVFTDRPAADGKFDGELKIIEDETGRIRTVKFTGVKNVSVLKCALLLKALMGHESFKGLIRYILQIDNKIEKR
jgi:hypothetical protein